MGSPIGAWSGFPYCGHGFIKLVFVDFPLYIVRSLLNVSENGLKNLTPTGAQSHARLVFILQRVTVFISNCVEAERRLLGMPGTTTGSAFRQSVGFFRLRPGKVAYLRFSFSNSFPRGSQ